MLKEEVMIVVILISLLDELLPWHITQECLVQLQYCQEISQCDASAFPSLLKPDSSNQSFLFIPALCTVGKSDVSQATPPGIGYSIGWLVKCADTSCDYFSSMFSSSDYSLQVHPRSSCTKPNRHQCLS